MKQVISIRKQIRESLHFFWLAGMNIIYVNELHYSEFLGIKISLSKNRWELYRGKQDKKVV